SNVQCGAPGKKGHTNVDCFWPGGGKEGQWPAWWKGKKGPTAPTTANTVETFAFSVWTIPEAVMRPYDEDGIQASREYRVVADSAATDHCFWKREDFTEY
ncbi:hypothetical protein B0H17DRAFT_908093, partial [Mycena rosella]